MLEGTAAEGSSIRERPPLAFRPMREGSPEFSRDGGMAVRGSTVLDSTEREWARKKELSSSASPAGSKVYSPF